MIKDVYTQMTTGFDTRQSECTPDPMTECILNELADILETNHKLKYDRGWMGLMLDMMKDTED